MRKFEFEVPLLATRFSPVNVLPRCRELHVPTFTYGEVVTHFSYDAMARKGLSRGALGYSNIRHVDTQYHAQGRSFTTCRWMSNDQSVLGSRNGDGILCTTRVQVEHSRQQLAVAYIVHVTVVTNCTVCGGTECPDAWVWVYWDMCTARGILYSHSTIDLPMLSPPLPRRRMTGV